MAAVCGDAEDEEEQQQEVLRPSATTPRPRSHYWCVCVVVPILFRSQSFRGAIVQLSFGTCVLL
jgi:hypothetical protein